MNCFLFNVFGIEEKIKTYGQTKQTPTVAFSIRCRKLFVFTLVCSTTLVKIIHATFSKLDARINNYKTFVQKTILARRHLTWLLNVLKLLNHQMLLNNVRTFRQD